MDDRITTLDRSAFKIDPASYGDDLLKYFSKFPEFKYPIPEVDTVAAIRYIILMYDPNNEEIKSEYPDINTRRRECALMAGFKIVDEKFMSKVEDCLVGMVEEFNQMVIRYIKLFQDSEYLNYLSFQNMLEKESLKSFTETDSKEIKIIRENLEKLNDQLHTITRKIFRGDNIVALKKSLYASMEREKLKLRPEDVASDLLLKKLNLKVDPYGYHVAKLQ